MISQFKKWTFIFIFVGLISSVWSETKKEKDEYKENFMSQGPKQILALKDFHKVKRHDLYPEVVKLLKNPKSSEEVVALTEDIVLGYEDDLERYSSDAFGDIQWILLHTNRDQLIIQLLQQILVKKDRRFFYDIITFITHRNADVREHAFKALSNYKDDRIIPFILELANSPKPLFRYYYLEAMNYIQDDRAMHNISILLTDPSPAIRSECIVVIEKLNLKEKINHIVSMATNDSNYEVRKTAVLSIKNQKLKSKSAVLAKTLKDKNNEVRIATIEAINEFKDKAFAKNVSEALMKEPLTDIKILMINSMLNLKSHGGGAGLSFVIKNASEIEVRRLSAKASGTLLAESTSPALLYSLKNEKEDIVRIEVARSLGLLKVKNAIPTFLDELELEKGSQSFRKEILLSLEKIDDPRVLPEIFDIIETTKDLEIKTTMKGFMRKMLYKFHKPTYRTHSAAKVSNFIVQ